MKFLSAAVLGAALISSLTPAFAQPYGGRDYGYDRGDYDSRAYRGRDRDDDYRDRRDYGRDYDRDPRGGRGDVVFDEREYLRCNPDVRRAVMSGQVRSGLFHYQRVGRSEGRRLSC